MTIITIITDGHHSPNVDDYDNHNHNHNHDHNQDYDNDDYWLL